MAAYTEAAATFPAAGETPGAAGRGTNHACSGRQMARLAPASTQRAWRQPRADTRYWVTGMQTVLAKPPTRVRVMIPRGASRPRAAVTTAKAGSYSTPDMLTPTSAQTR